MHISVRTTKNASHYQVRLNGNLVEHWVAADDDAGYIVREVPDTTGVVRFMQTMRETGTVVITPPPEPKAT